MKDFISRLNEKQTRNLMIHVEFFAFRDSGLDDDELFDIVANGYKGVNERLIKNIRAELRSMDLAYLYEIAKSEGII